MPRLLHATPKYRKHKASGQAVVTVAGKDHYLGPWNTKASKAEYDRLVAEWLANGRPVCQPAPVAERTIAELLAAYWRFAQGYYVKNGKPIAGCLAGIKVALGFVRRTYGHTPAADFGPLALQVLQRQMIDAGQCRTYVNNNIDRIRRCFKWGVANQIVPSSVYQALQAVPGLCKGKTDARVSVTDEGGTTFTGQWSLAASGLMSG